MGRRGRGCGKDTCHGFFEVVLIKWWVQWERNTFPTEPHFGFGLELVLGLIPCVILGESLDQSEPHLPSLMDGS